MAKEKDIDLYLNDDALNLSIASTEASETNEISSVIDYQGNFIKQAKGLLLEQYKESENLNKLLKLHVWGLQELENVFENLLNDRFLDSAYGSQLDGLGTILNEKRNFRQDEEYRRALYIKVLINNSGGTAEDIMAIIKLVYNPIQLLYTDIYPARFQLFLRTEDNINGIIKLISSIKPIGVSFDIICALDEDYFRFNLTTVALFDYWLNDNEEQRYLDNLGDNLQVRGGATINRGGYFNIVLYNRLPRMVNSEGDPYLVNAQDEQVLVSDLINNYKIIGDMKFAVVLYREALV